MKLASDFSFLSNEAVEVLLEYFFEKLANLIANDETNLQHAYREFLKLVFAIILQKNNQAAYILERFFY